MARYNHPWKKVLVWGCAAFAVLALLLLCLARVVCQSTDDAEFALIADRDDLSATEIAPVIEFQLLKKSKFARLPKTFWQSHLSEDAYWNKHQAVIDYHFNPLLSHYDKSIDVDNTPFYESVLKRSFSQVAAFVGPMELPEMLQDFVSTMHIRDYSTHIQPNGLCGAGATDEKEPPMILLGIKSAADNFDNRQAIRQTWGKAGWVSGKSSRAKGSGGYVRRVFLMASKSKPSSALLAESELYGDILQWNFKDTFFNLSLKDVLFWKWFSRYCGKTRFVFKGDDDVFVNTIKMIIYLRDQIQRPQAEKRMQTFMVGYVIGGTSPIRDETSKYYIPDNFYQGVYPAYPCGGGLIYSGVLAKRLYHVSKRVHLFPIDDAFVGMCLVRLNTYPIHHPAFLIYDFPGKDKEAKCSYQTMLMIHKRSPSQMSDIWAHLKKTEEECWDTPLRHVYIPQHLLPMN